MCTRISILFSFFLLCLSLEGQQYNFHNYSVSDGLAQSQVYAMCEDARGYLWLGTQGGGVSRFNGSEFKNYNEDDSLISPFINCISTDKQGNIFIGTNAGLSVFDGNKFSNFSDSLNNTVINAILISKEGKMFVATNSGLFIFKNNLFIGRLPKSTGLETAHTTSLFEDKDGTIWAGGTGFVAEQKKESWIVFRKNDGVPATNVVSITRDGNNRLWIATSENGISYLNDEEKFISFSGKGILNGIFSYCLLTDHTGKLWMGTNLGAYKIDGEEIKYFSDAEGLSNKKVRSLMEDSWGNIWFGTNGGGACMLDGERFIHFDEKNGFMGTWTYDVFCDRNGNQWFATSNGGVTEYDGFNFKNYKDDDGFTSEIISTIGEDTSGRIWFGTSGNGAYYFDKGEFKHFQHQDGLSGRFISAFATDSFNREWIATLDGGISIYDPLTQKFIVPGKDHGVTATRIQCLGKDQEGNIYAGTQTEGFYKMQFDSFQVDVEKTFGRKETGFASNNIRSATCDRYGNMWFGVSGGGIFRYDGTTFTHYTKTDSLASNNIYLLIADKAENIWAGTEKGLDKISYTKDGKINSIKHYGKGEGLIGIETTANATCLDTSTGVWFGTIRGACVYHPENDFVNTEPPRIHLTGIKLFFEPLENTSFWNIPKNKNWFPIPDSLTLPYSENSLRFEFEGIDLKNPEGVRFKWMLSGFDKNWSPENTERQATYSNLPPGDYVFMIQAKNADGFWSPMQQFSFRITPAYYATLSFRIIAGLFILIVVGIIFSWRVRLIKRKTKQQLEKVTLEKHVLELEQKALRLQMNPHFIFNALQSIQGFIARNDSAEARKYLAKFGKLMRLTLENSRQSYTSIEQEAELLEYYLGLEALCHGNRFTYSIETDERINPEATFIPVMLIQPFVENAVLHGMKHLGETKGKITIRFLLNENLISGKPDESVKSISVEIEDNGVGRKKAAEFEIETKKDHKSAALQITRERLSQVNEKGKAESKLEIIDLLDKDGNATGTKVVIRIGNVVFE